MGGQNPVKMLVGLPLVGSFVVAKWVCEQWISAMPGMVLARD